MRLPILFLCTFLFTALYAQEELYIPLEFQEAYDNGTRSMDGKPGPNYWQNEADYTMELTVDPATRLITGSETIVYYNRSPRDLSNLVLRTYYDIYAPGNPREGELDPSDMIDGVSITKVTINGEEFKLDQINKNGTNRFVQLPEPLVAGGEVTLELEWNTEIPKTNRRVGTYDSTSFFIGYFYPQVAAYDDVFGWDTYDYLGSAEFYNTLADFDVRITVPENYLVKASGVLQNGQEVMPGEMYERYQEAQSTDETVVLISQEQAGAGYTMAGTTWHYVAEQVPDFAFFTSDHYIWEGSSQEVDGRRVFISTLFPPRNAQAFDGVTQLQREIMDYFSTEITGIPYPYPAYSSINALNGGGMEFPMLANNASVADPASRASLTAHEMHHMYLPFYVRTNERRYSWMDEGWADYITDFALTRRVVGAEYEEQARGNMLAGLGALGTYSHLPLITNTMNMNGENYGYSSYMLPHYIYDQLYQLLGEETFVRCLREYIRRWAYKSPTPYDFFFTFNDVSGQNLNWFWNAWFFEFSAPDLALGEVKGRKVTVHQVGKKPLPVQLEATFADGTVEELQRPATIWNESDQVTLKLTKKGELTRLLLNKAEVDARPVDNIYLSEWPAASALEALSGKYIINQNIDIDLEPEGRKAVTMVINPFGFRFTLFPDGEGGFATLSGGAKMMVNKEGEEVKGIVVTAFNQTIPARKQD